MRLAYKLIIIIGIVMLPISMFNHSVSAKTIQELEEELNELDKEQKELKSEKRSISGEKQEIESEMNENKEKQQSIQSKINEIDNKISSTNSSIKEKENEITETDEEINELEKNIKQLNKETTELKVKINDRLNLLKDRLRSIQESGGFVNYITVIFGSNSFGDLISRSTTVSTIMDSDKSLMKQLEQDQFALIEKEKEVSEHQKEVKKQKEQLEKQKVELVQMKKDLDSQKANQAELKEKLAKEFEELEDHSLTVEEEQKLIDSQAKYIEEAKRLANKSIEEKKRAQEQEQQNNSNNQGNPIKGNGQYIWPTDSKRITSHFNPNRFHPIFGYPRPHNGVDIGASTPGRYGENIYAAASGIVSTVEYSNSGLGNHIMLVHGSSTTVYGHLNSINVSVGQAVNQGDIIGAMGSSGDSSGPHLHFEVHPGGYKNPVNPLQYFN